MRSGFEFSFHTLASPGEDHELAMRGSLGWEIRGIAVGVEGKIVVALQRPLNEDMPLPHADAVAIALEAPIAVTDVE